MNTKIQERIQQEGLASSKEVRQAKEANQVGNAVKAEEKSQSHQSRVIRIDQYIPSKGGQTESFGHYQPVKDENGNKTIQFRAPTDASDSVPATFGTPKGAEPQKEAGGTPKSQTDSFGLSSGKLKLMGLKNKQKKLEQQIRQAPDPDSKQELKKKLALVKRDVKAAKQ